MFNRRQLSVLESRLSSYLCLGKFSFVVINSNMFVYYKYYVLQLDYLWKNEFAITYFMSNTTYG